MIFNWTLALIGGIIPTLIWMWIFLRGDIKTLGFLVLSAFLGGGLAVALSLPLETLSVNYFGPGHPLTIFLWAGLEEIFKLLPILIILRFKEVKPYHIILLMIVSALGFAAAENTLFLINPLFHNDYAGALITGNLRYMGAALMHVFTSSIIGFSLATEKKESTFGMWVVLGYILAVFTHSIFNLFISNASKENALEAFGAFILGSFVLFVLLRLFKKSEEKYVQTTA